MSHQSRFSRYCQALIITLLLSSIFLSSCSSKTKLPAVGPWTATAEFGTVDFTVSSDSSMITNAVFNFNEFQCGPAISTGSIEISYSDGLKITDGAINIELTNTFTSPAPPDPFNPIPPASDVEVVNLSGNFSPDGKTASGDWTATFNDNSCSQGKWTAGPNE